MANPNIPLADQIACIERVLALRHRLFPGFIEGADLEVARMEAALATLKGLQRQSGGLFDNPDEGLTVEAIDR